MDLKTFINAGKHKMMPIKSSPEETNKFVAYQIICGVNYCLTKGIINRDIKPQNVLIYDDGTVKIADFGLARAAICSFDSGITNEVYTLWYRPPEILLGAKYEDSADVWALGCTLYELYDNLPLFPGSSQWDMVVAFEEEFGSLIQLWPEIANLPNWHSMYLIGKKDQSKLSLIEDKHVKDIIKGMLSINPHTRSRLQHVLQDSYFDSVRDPSLQIYYYLFLHPNPPRTISASRI